jgi:hypothetical protein
MVGCVLWVSGPLHRQVEAGLRKVIRQREDCRCVSCSSGNIEPCIAYGFSGCSSAIYTGASNLTVRSLEPSCKSQRIHFQSWDELSRYLPSRDQLKDWICLVWPRSLRATPLVSTSNITTVPSTLPEARKSPLRLKRTQVEWPLRKLVEVDSG